MIASRVGERIQDVIHVSHIMTFHVLHVLHQRRLTKEPPADWKEFVTFHDILVGSYGPVKYSKPNTVDGRNPATVDMVNIPLFAGFHTSQVVQEFFRQQYHEVVSAKG